MPTSGLTMYMPLSDSLTTPEIGDNFSYIGNPVLTTNGGIPCVYLSGGGCGLYSTSGTYYSDSDTEVSLSIWAKKGTSLGDVYFAIGNWVGPGYSFELTTFEGYTTVTTLTYNYPEKLFQVDDDWHHYVITTKMENGTQYGVLYIDGVLVGTQSFYGYSLNVVQHLTGIGGNFDTSDNFPRDGTWIGWLAAARIYNRILTQEEITLLSQEFTPTVDPVFNNQSLSFNNDDGAETKQLSFDTKGRSYEFSITSGTLPTGVTFNTANGSFTYDGTTISQDQDFALTIQLSGSGLTTTTATVTLEMRVEGPRIPTSGLFFYMPLENASVLSAATGQSMELEGVTETAYINGIHCVKFNHYTFLTEYNDTSAPSGRHSFTMSIWMKYITSWDEVYDTALAFGYQDSYQNPHMGQRYDYYLFNFWSNDWSIYSPQPTNDWTNLVCVCDVENNSKKIYVNGTLAGSEEIGELNINPYFIRIGDDGSSAHRYFAAARIYDRALTSAEVLALSEEFEILTDPVFEDQIVNFSNTAGAENWQLMYDSKGLTPEFGIVSGTLPAGVTFDSASGIFEFDGTAISQSGEFDIGVMLSGQGLAPTSAVVTMYMTDQPWENPVDYFYMKSLSADNNIVFSNIYNNGFSTINLQYSPDKLHWHNLNEATWDSSTQKYSWNLQNAGDKIYFRNDTGVFSDTSNIYNFTSTKDSEVGGKLVSLLDKNANEVDTQSKSYIFASLLYANSNLIHASGLVFPYIDPSNPDAYSAEYGYAWMFINDNRLITPPSSLNTVQIGSHGCESMFYSCSDLQSTPTLNFRRFGDYACVQMFGSIATLPSAAILEDDVYGYYQYKEMFRGSFGLKRLQVYFNDWLDSFGNVKTENWMQYSSPTGLFEVPSTTTLDLTIRDDSHIPAGWNIGVIGGGAFIQAPSTMNFYTAAEAASGFAVACSEPYVLSVASGTLPSGVSLDAAAGVLSSTGLQTAAETQTVVLRAQSANYSAEKEIQINVIMNQVQVQSGNVDFYTGEGDSNYFVNWHGVPNEISGVSYTYQSYPGMRAPEGQHLPQGVFFSHASGCFVFTASQVTSEESIPVRVYVTPSANTTSPGSADLVVTTHIGDRPIPSDYVLYNKLTSISSDLSGYSTYGDITDYVSDAVIQGIPCISSWNDSSYNYYYISDSALPMGDAARTVSIWAYLDNEWLSSAESLLLKWGLDGDYHWWRQFPTGSELYMATLGSEYPTDYGLSARTWYHIAACYGYDENDGYFYKLYVNGTLKINDSNQMQIDTQADWFRLFGDHWDTKLHGAITAVRIYDRVLSQAEINQLAAEFTPMV